jgi:hypothetical protein
MGLLDQMQPTPRNRMLGLLADALTTASDYANRPDKTMPGGLANPPLSAVSGLLGLPSIATTAQRLSYGEPLTNIGKANVPLMKPETMDTLMTLAPMAMAAAPYVAKGAKAGLANLEAANTTGRLPMAGQRGAVVWHGSPHKFDKFDASKIGTGEGAQAYGHGVYLAQAKEVADEYAGKLSKAVIDFKNKAPSDDFERAVHDRINKSIESMSYQGRYDAAKQAWGRLANPMVHDLDGIPGLLKPLEGEARANRLGLRDAARRLGEPSVGDSGSLYKVDLPDEHIAKMLDWDKPLSQQAGAQSALDALQAAPELPRGFGGAIKSARSRSYFDGNDLYQELVKVMPNAEAAQVMKRAGIPGIRYLDGGSRGAGAGTSNYVVFPGNEGLLQILERNGVPLGK